jgi:hypothetical protein
VRVTGHNVPSGVQSYSVVGIASAAPTAVTALKQATTTQSRLPIFIQLATLLVLATVLAVSEWLPEELTDTYRGF